MRNTLVVAFSFYIFLLSTPSGAQSTKCATMKIPDDRMVCNAVTSGNKSWCGFIKDSQKRAWCYVLLEKK